MISFPTWFIVLLRRIYYCVIFIYEKSRSVHRMKDIMETNEDKYSAGRRE